jgi:tetratricopeptide (TPR) repeat protein
MCASNVDPAVRPRGFLRRALFAVAGTRRRLTILITGVMVLAVVSTVAVGYIGRELHFRKAQAAAEKWAVLQSHAAKQDMPGVRAELDAITALTPNDANIVRWRTALDDGKADPADLGMVRFVMNEHLRAGRLDAAALEAAVRVAALPKDWQARCVLAHAALTHGDRAAAIAHLEALPSPFDLEKNPGPGPVMYAIRLHQQLGLTSLELTSFVVLELLPALESSQVGYIQLGEKLGLLDAFEHAGKALDAHPDVARFWVPAAALGRQAADDPAATTADLMRLGYLFEGQLALLAELRKRSKLPPEDADRLARELDDRIRATWLKVLDRDPKEPAGHIGLALVQFRAGAVDDAVATLDRGLEACGGRVELLAAFADVTRRRDPQSGLELLMRAVRQRPNDPVLWRLAAETAVAANRPDVALSACDEVLGKRPGEPWACRTKAGLLLGQGRATEAVAALEPTRASFAQDGLATELYVRALCAAGAAPLADPLLKEMTGRPDAVPGLLGGGRALLKAGRPESATAWAEEAVRRAPEDHSARLLHADSLRAWAEEDAAPAWNQDRVREAVRAYEWLRDRDSDDLAIANNLAWLQLKGQRRPTTADASAAPLRARMADNRGLPPEMLETLGAIDLEIEQPARAAKLLESATRGPSPRPGYWTHLARAYLQLGRRSDAKKCIDKAAELPRSVRESDDLATTVKLWQNPPKSR